MHGVLPEEQSRAAAVRGRPRAPRRLSAAGASDDLDDTVDYGAVCDAVSRVVSRSTTGCSSGSRRASPRSAAPIRGCRARSWRCASCTRRCARGLDLRRPCASNGESRARTSRSGSNLGDRLAHLQLAVDGLARGRRCRRRRRCRASTRPRRSAGRRRIAYLNAVVAIDTELDPHALLALAQRIEARRATRARRALGPAHARRRRAARRRRPPRRSRPHRCRTRGCGSAASSSRRSATSRPTLVDADAAWEGVREAAVTLHIPWRKQTSANRRPDRTRTRRNDDRARAARTGLDRRRGRRAARPTRRPRPSAAACLASRPALVSEVGARRRPRDRRHSRPRHRAGAAARPRPRSSPARSWCTSRVRAVSTCSRRCSTRRTGVRVGALHPLQSFPSATVGLERLRRRLGRGGGRSATSPSSRDRSGCGRSSSPTPTAARYHAAAVVASNHLVALLGQVERLAGDVRRPVRGVRAARARLGAERVRARSGRCAHRTGRPRRPHHRRAASPRPRPGRARRVPRARARGRPAHRPARHRPRPPARRPPPATGGPEPATTLSPRRRRHAT